MKIDFSQIMGQRSDDELIEILTKKQDEYQEEALEAAQREFKKRNLTAEQITSAIKVVEKKEDIIKAKAAEPLNEGWKKACFFLPGLTVYFVTFSFWKTDGYKQKIRDAWRWSWYGTAFYFVLFTLIKILTK
jgi:hypothetical protein